jgi:hypothetical protein
MWCKCSLKKHLKIKTEVCNLRGKKVEVSPRGYMPCGKFVMVREESSHPSNALKDQMNNDLWRWEIGKLIWTLKFGPWIKDGLCFDTERWTGLWLCVRVCNLKVENFKRQKDSNLSKGDWCDLYSDKLVERTRSVAFASCLENTSKAL